MTTKIWYDISRDSLSLLRYSDRPDGREMLMPNGELLMVPRGHIAPREACIEIREPQQLLDELLQAGYRPSSNAWSSGHVNALEKHIAFAEKVANAFLEKP